MARARIKELDNVAMRLSVFIRSLVNLDRLTNSEIVGRLFFWWFGPGFVLLGVETFGILPRGITSEVPATVAN